MAKRLEDLKEVKIERPPRIKLSGEESLKRTQEFDKRKEQFIAAIRKGKREAFMSRTITISDELYARLEAEARTRGLGSIERLLEEREESESDLNERKRVVKRIDDLRERLFTEYGEMPDSVELLRADRNR